MDDAHYMRKALAIAERGRGTTSPNPLVGALVVDDEGVIVGRGAHRVCDGPGSAAHHCASRRAALRPGHGKSEHCRKSEPNGCTIARE